MQQLLNKRPATTDIAIVRNRQRQGKGRVPDVAIFTTQKKLQPPVPEEGFDEVRVIDCETLR